jgi:hypothetical protein
MASEVKLLKPAIPLYSDTSQYCVESGKIFVHFNKLKNLPIILGTTTLSKSCGCLDDTNVRNGTWCCNNCELQKLLAAIDPMTDHTGIN